MTEDNKNVKNQEEMPHLEPSQEVDFQMGEETEKVTPKVEETKKEEVKKPTLEEQKRADEKKLHKSSPKIFVILAAVILIVISFVGYYVFASNPKRILVSSIDSLNKKMNTLNTNISKYQTNLKDNFKLDGSMSVKINSDILEAYGSMGMYPELTQILTNLENTEFQYEYQQNIEDKKLYFKLTPSLNGKELTNVTYYNESSNQYILIKEIASEYLELDQLDIFDTLQNTNMDDYNYIVDVVKDSLYQHVTKNDFNISNVKVKIDGEDKEVKKVALTLDAKRANELFDQVINDLKKDKKANKIMNRISPEFKNYKKQEVDNKDSSVLNFITYVTKFSHEPVKYALTVTDSYTKKESGMAFTDGETKEFEIIENEKVIGTIEIKGNLEKFDITLKDANGKSLGTGKGSYQETKANFDMSLNMDKDMILAFHMNTKKAGNQTDSSFQCEILSSDNQSLLSFEIADTNTIDNNANIKVDTEGSRKMTKADEQKLSIWLQQLLANYLVTE